MTYCIEWGDNSGECIGPFSSGTDVKLKHMWMEKGTFVISVKSTNIYGTDSEWNSMDVAISKARSFIFKDFKFLYNCKILFKLLTKLKI